MDKKIKIEEIGVIAKLSDGTIRQVLTDTRVNDAILSLINAYYEKIKISEEKISTIEILTQKKD